MIEMHGAKRTIPFWVKFNPTWWFSNEDDSLLGIDRINLPLNMFVKVNP